MAKILDKFKNTLANLANPKYREEVDLDKTFPLQSEDALYDDEGKIQDQHDVEKAMASIDAGFVWYNDPKAQEAIKKLHVQANEFMNEQAISNGKLEQDPSFNKLTGIKYDQDKLRYDLMPVLALEDVVQVLTFGASKYKDNNWRGGMKWSRPISACFRHLYAWLRGETNDKETGINHLAHACVNLMFILEYTKTNTGVDDRYPVESKEQP